MSDIKLTEKDIVFIENQLGYNLGDVGRERVEQLRNLGATLDEIVEALELL